MHVVNLTLNLVRGRKLAWQERKAAPFAVTPMHAGSYYLGYRESRDYGGKDGISIGTAAAISGAAVSPNMGYSSSPVTALLLTLFNVRLGWWLGNPGIAGNDTYRCAEPRFSLRPLIAEALGLTDEQSPYVYLSDGGHFENLGLYEMVLRRCRCIVVSDAGADPDYEFEDLGNAVRKIRIDLGIPIEFDAMRFARQRSAQNDDGRYCALGRIRYSVVDGGDAPDGVVHLPQAGAVGKRAARRAALRRAQERRFPQEPTATSSSASRSSRAIASSAKFETRALCAGECRFDSKNAWARFLVEAARKNLGLGQEHWIDLWLESLAERREITLVGDGAKAA